jgi:hypothetical protein
VRASPYIRVGLRRGNLRIAFGAGGPPRVKTGAKLRYRIIIASLLLSLAGAAAQAPRGRDQGDWPCRQAKVGTIALASVWSGPLLDTAAQDWRGDAEVSALVTRVSERRTPLEEAQSAISDYAKHLAKERKDAKLTQLMAGIFDRLNSERDAVIAGLERYGHKQKDMAERVKSEIEALNTAQSEATTDQQKIAELSTRVQWDTRVFEDRRRALTYVCETPVLIEQRLGALARAIAAAMES